MKIFTEVWDKNLKSNKEVHHVSVMKNIIKMNFKNIHLGSLIRQHVTENGVEVSRICNFMKCPSIEVEEMYQQENLPTHILLKWCKLLEYDFFRLYSQHLILYTSPSKSISKKTNLPRFRKSVYTAEMIDFILEQINTGEMTKNDVMERYRIPKTTLYKWLSKYSKQ